MRKLLFIVLALALPCWGQTCKTTTIAKVSRVVLQADTTKEFVAGNFSYYTTGVPTVVSITIEAGNELPATQTPFTKIAAVTSTTGADMGSASGAYRYWYANLGTLTAGTSPTIVLTACFGTHAWSRFAWPATGISGGILGFTSPTTLASSVLLTANALIVGGGAGATPTPLALGTANYLLGMNAGGTANEYKALGVGTTGTDFAVAHAANTVTFNLPDASATARGAVTTGAQTFAGTKTFRGLYPFAFDGATAGTFTTVVSVTDPTANNVLTIPNADSVAVQPDAGAASNFLTAISTLGVVSKAQPAFTNISGIATTTQGGTGANLSAAGAGTYPKASGAGVYAASTLAASGVGTPTACTNQFVSGFTLAGDAAPVSTCTSIVAGDLGTTMTPQFARIGLGAAADATDPLNVYNGNALFKYGHIKFTSQVKPGAPTSNAPTDGGACTDGSHVIATSFVTSNGETEYGAVSAAQTCVLGTTKQTIPMSAIPTGITGVTTGRNMCASKAGTVTPLYQVGASPTIANNSTTTYDFVTADASLTVACNATNSTTGGLWVDGTVGLFIDPVTKYVSIGTAANPSGFLFNVPGAAYLGIGYLGTANITDLRIPGKMNGINTVANGVPAEYAVYDPAELTAALGATTLYAVPAAGAGRYRVSWVAKIITAATTSSVLGGTNGFQLTYTDADDSVAVTPLAVPNAVATGNTTGTQLSGVVIANCKASTNLQIQFDYTSVGATPMGYKLHVIAEKL